MSIINPITPGKLAQLKAAMAKQPSHDVTLFPIYSERNPEPKASYHGCLDSDRVMNAELPGGSFIDSLRKAQAKGTIALQPGHWLLLEWSEDIEEHRGLVFTVHADGTISPQCLADQHVSMVSWPPKRLSV